METNVVGSRARTGAEKGVGGRLGLGLFDRGRGDIAMGDCFVKSSRRDIGWIV